MQATTVIVVSARALHMANAFVVPTDPTHLALTSVRLFEQDGNLIVAGCNPHVIGMTIENVVPPIDLNFGIPCGVIEQLAVEEVPYHGPVRLELTRSGDCSATPLLSSVPSLQLKWRDEDVPFEHKGADLRYRLLQDFLLHSSRFDEVRTSRQHHLTADNLAAILKAASHADDGLDPEKLVKFYPSIDTIPTVESRFQIAGCPNFHGLVSEYRPANRLERSLEQAMQQPTLHSRRADDCHAPADGVALETPTADILAIASVARNPLSWRKSLAVHVHGTGSRTLIITGDEGRGAAILTEDRARLPFDIVLPYGLIKTLRSKPDRRVLLNLVAHGRCSVQARTSERAKSTWSEIFSWKDSPVADPHPPAEVLRKLATQGVPGACCLQLKDLAAFTEAAQPTRNDRARYSPRVYGRGPDGLAHVYLSDMDHFYGYAKACKMPEQMHPLADIRNALRHSSQNPKVCASPMQAEELAATA